MIRCTVIGLVLLLAACSSRSDPTGIGSGRDQLKESPCACQEIPMPNFRHG